MPARPRTLLCGTTGKDVEELKYHLNVIGYQNYFFDGVSHKQRTMLPYLDGTDVFDSLTLFRVKEFQKFNNLKPDGIVGKKTHAVIGNWLDILQNKYNVVL